MSDQGEERICAQVLELIRAFKCRMTMRVPEAMLGCCEPVVLGIDEAGRGCVLGSMVYGAVVWRSDEDQAKIASLGLKDSKQLTARQRQQSLQKCREAEWLASITLEVFADELALAMDSGVNLNELSHRMIVAACRQVQHQFQLARVCCDTVGPEGTLQAKIQAAVGSSVEVVVAPRADSLFAQVSAASIFAKETRDELLGLLAQEVERYCQEEPGTTLVRVVGSGYSSDAKTIAWLESVVRLGLAVRFRKWIRTSWATYKRIAGQ